MTAITESPSRAARSKGVPRVKKLNLRIDMTPMVDLGFLLVTFFVITSQLSEPRSMPLNMPKDGPPMTLGNSNALTVLLGNGQVFYYHGDWDAALAAGQVFPSSLSVRDGLGQVIRKRQHLLDQPGVSGEGRKGLMLLIKATEQTNYSTLINTLDETLINGVQKYAIVKPEPGELEFIKKH